ncbi:unnamed protein product, partial [marine sediment metagenome]
PPMRADRGRRPAPANGAAGPRTALRPPAAPGSSSAIDHPRHQKERTT